MYFTIPTFWSVVGVFCTYFIARAVSDYLEHCVARCGSGGVYNDAHEV